MRVAEAVFPPASEAVTGPVVAPVGMGKFVLNDPEESEVVEATFKPPKVTVILDEVRKFFPLTDIDVPTDALAGCRVIEGVVTVNVKLLDVLAALLLSPA